MYLCVFVCGCLVVDPFWCAALSGDGKGYVDVNLKRRFASYYFPVSPIYSIGAVTSII